MILRLPTAEAARRYWRDNLPFPHILVSDALHEDDAALITSEYPAPDSGAWHTFDGPLERGKQEASASTAGENVARLHAELASDGFVNWLREVSGIPDLIADPLRVGGGIHQSGPDARLGSHVDFVLHPGDPTLIRAVNVIVFVTATPFWQESWGGYLILGAHREVSIAPLPGTFIAFEASDASWHGHPDPLAADAPLRRSVPAYFYRRLADGEVVQAHSTRFLETT